MILVVIIVLFLNINTYTYAEEISLTLDEAIAIALRENPQILLKTYDIQKAKYKLKESYSALYPTLTATVASTKTVDLYPDNNPTQITNQLSIRQIIYKGGKIINSIRYSETGIQIAQVILDEAKLDLVHNVKKAFYTLLLANESVNLNRLIYENAKKHFYVAKKRYKKGLISRSDMLVFNQMLITTKGLYEVSINQKKTAEAILANLLYLELDVEIKPEGKFFYKPQEIIYQKAYLEAISNRPEIKRYELLEEASKTQAQIVKSDSRPTIYVGWDYYIRSHTSGIGGVLKNWNDYSTISLGLSWPIFDGWATKERLNQILTELKEIQIAKGKIKKDIELELKIAYLELKNSIQKLEAIESEVTTYKDKFRTTKEKYKVGMASQLDLFDSYLAYKVSLFKKNQALYDYIVAKAKFDKATGGAI